MANKTTKTITRTIKEVHTLALTRDDVLRAVRLAYGEVPANASLILEVPRGGDYSGDRLGIGDFTHGLEVIWETRDEKTSTPWSHEGPKGD